jgi:hypothetical protein
MTASFSRRLARRAAAVLALSLALLSAPFVSAAVVGEQKTALLLVNFQDDASQPMTPAAAHAVLFGQASDYFWEASYHHTLLGGDTFGWYALPMAATCDTAAIGTAARNAATAAGVNLAAYSRLVIAYPRNASCVVSGTAAVGGTTIYINGGINVANIVHEMGHSFGLQHSTYLKCDNTPIGDTCTVSDYGDLFDAMGSSVNAPHYNAFQKERLGWLNASGVPPIGTVQASGSFQVAPYEAANNDPKAIRVLKGTDATTGARTWYYLEYRQPVGFDAPLAGLSYTNVMRGVLVHLVTEGDARSSRLLDMTPHSNTAYDNRNDAALAVGQSFTDAAAGITITTRSADANGALVDVVLAGGPPPPSCVRAAPTLTLSGPGTTVAAGTAVSYSVSVTNRDSAACAATSFNLARTVPTGWTGTLGAGTLSLAAGASGSTTLTVTSGSSTAAGTYPVSVATTSNVGATHSANASASQSIGSASPLTNAVGTDKTSYLRGETVYMSSRVLSGGNPVAGANVAFNLTAPGGVTTMIGAATGSDGYARATYKLGKGKGAIGNYALRADASSGTGSASSSNAFAVK